MNEIEIDSPIREKKWKDAENVMITRARTRWRGRRRKREKVGGGWSVQILTLIRIEILILFYCKWNVQVVGGVSSQTSDSMPPLKKNNNKKKGNAQSVKFDF